VKWPEASTYIVLVIGCVAAIFFITRCASTEGVERIRQDALSERSYLERGYEDCSSFWTGKHWCPPGKRP
jgi:hypothetical protein